MDLITHALIGAAIAPDKHLALPMALSGTVPDWWTIPPLAEYLWRHRGRYNNPKFWAWIPARYDGITRWSHSVVPLIVAGVIGAVVFKTSAWVFLPWLLHILVDIPTHAKSRTGYLLYPWSRWQPTGTSNWYDRWWVSVVAIIVLGFIVYLRFY